MEQTSLDEKSDSTQRTRHTTIVASLAPGTPTLTNSVPAGPREMCWVEVVLVKDIQALKFDFRG